MIMLVAIVEKGDLGLARNLALFGNLLSGSDLWLSYGDGGSSSRTLFLLRHLACLTHVAGASRFHTSVNIIDVVIEVRHISSLTGYLASLTWILTSLFNHFQFSVVFQFLNI